MIDNTEDTEWLNDCPELSKLSRNNPFLVPENYFEEQQENIRTSIFLEKLKDSKQQQAFTVPEDYFNTMQEQVLSAVRLEEIRLPESGLNVPDQFFEEQQSIISALATVNGYAEKATGFSVPAGYFEELSDRINQKNTEKTIQQPSKVRNLFVKATWKYATAACIIFAAATGIYIKQYQSINKKTIQSQLSNLSDAEIENYLEINSDTYDSHFLLENTASDANFNVDDNQLSTDRNAGTGQ